MKIPSRWLRATILLVTLGTFALRITYVQHSHLFFDEFTSILAIKTILTKGWPVLPSGLFYEHGLFFSYLALPAAWLAQLGPQPTLFPLIRLVSLGCSTLITPLIYKIGYRWFSKEIGLVAAILFALSPEGLVWGGRARMYALTQLLVLLLVYAVYEGAYHNRPIWRWIALLILLAALLTQLAVIILVPPLLVAMVLIWQRNSSSDPPEGAKTAFSGAKSSLLWGARGAIVSRMGEIMGLGLVLGIGILIKRLGQPLGVAQLGSETTDQSLLAVWPGFLLELWQTMAYQVGVNLDWANSLKFLTRQFGVPHHIWLSLVAIVGFGGFVMLGHSVVKRFLWPYFFLWLVFGLTIVEMLTLIEPFRRNPRYLVMALPLFYLIVAVSLLWPIHSRDNVSFRPLTLRWSHFRQGLFLLSGLSMMGLHTYGLSQDLKIAYLTPEPAYDEALQYVAALSQADDALLSMNASAVGLYQPEGHYYFAMQQEAEQFLLQSGQSDANPIDRWLGSPWVGTTEALNRVLNTHPNTWFIVDTIRLPAYYRGDWLALLNSQMDLVWAEDEALVYQTRADRQPIPQTPRIWLEAQFGEIIQLQGYTLIIEPSLTSAQLTLFWLATTPPDVDYTIFIHLRDQNRQIVAQWDRQPLEGLYPTIQWQPGEQVIESMTLSLPQDVLNQPYHLAVGLYRLDTLTRLPLQDDISGENAVFLKIMSD